MISNFITLTKIPYNLQMGEKHFCDITLTIDMWNCKDIFKKEKEKNNNEKKWESTEVKIITKFSLYACSPITRWLRI